MDNTRTSICPAIFNDSFAFRDRTNMGDFLVLGILLRPFVLTMSSDDDLHVLHKLRVIRPIVELPTAFHLVERPISFYELLRV